MPKHARKWSSIAIAMTISGLLLTPASSIPNPEPPVAEVKIEAATNLLPGGLAHRAKAYLSPSPLSTPEFPIMVQVDKISAEKLAQDEAAKKAAEAERNAHAEAVKAKLAREAAEKKAAEEAAAKKAAEEAAAKKATVVVPNGGGITCGPRSGDSHLQEWPALVRTRIAKQFSISDIGGYRPTTSGEHGLGLALDVMTYSNSAKGDQVLQWVLAHHDELNVYYVIWEQHIYGSWTGWKAKPMEDRGSITANHFDHVHISFNSGMGTCPAN